MLTWFLDTIYDGDDGDGGFTSSGFLALCPSPRWASLSCAGIYNKIKYSFVQTLPSISGSRWLWANMWVCGCVRVHSEGLGPAGGVMTRRQSGTKAHVQKSSCFIVRGRTELCGEVQSRSSSVESERGWRGWRSKKNEYTLVAELNYGLHKHVMASARARRIQTWPVRFTPLVKPISGRIFIHTRPHTGSVTPAWPEPILLSRQDHMWPCAAACTTSEPLRLNSFDTVMV